MPLKTNRYFEKWSIQRSLMCLVCFLSHHCLQMSYGTKKLRKSASRERTCIVLPFRVFPIAAPPSSWIRSRNLRPTSLDIGEHHDAGGRCVIGSIAFSSERQFSQDCRCGIIGTVNNILSIRCFGNHIDLKCVSNGPTRRKSSSTFSPLCQNCGGRKGCESIRQAFHR